MLDDISICWGALMKTEFGRGTDNQLYSAVFGIKRATVGVQREDNG